MVTNRGSLRPWDPIFFRQKRKGALNAVVGNTPSSAQVIGTGSPTQANQVASGSGDHSLTYYQEVLADSPEVYWRMNESSGTNANDSTPNNSDATYVNSPTLGVTGPYAGTTGMTSAFTGTKYLSYTPGATFFTNLDPFTIEIWAMSSLAANLTLFTARSTAAGLPGYMLRINATGAVDWVGFGAGATSISTSTGEVSANVWTHIALTRDGSNNAIFYVDGVSVSTGTISTINSPGNALRLSGAVTTAAGPTIVGSDGTMSDLAIWDSAISGARIAAHYAAAF